MVEVRSYVASSSETKSALETLEAKIAVSDITPSFAYVFYGSGHDDRVIHAFLHRRFPGLPVIGGTLDAKLPHGGNILADTTMLPLGIDNGEIERVTQYLLVHPDAVTPGAGLSTFATLSEGTRVYGMCGDKQRLV